MLLTIARPSIQGRLTWVSTDSGSEQVSPWSDMLCGAGTGQRGFARAESAKLSGRTGLSQAGRHRSDTSSVHSATRRASGDAQVGISAEREHNCCNCGGVDQHRTRNCARRAPRRHNQRYRSAFLAQCRAPSSPLRFIPRRLPFSHWQQPSYRHSCAALNW